MSGAKLGILAVLIASVAVGVGAASHWAWTLDSLLVLRGASGALRCLADGQVIHCDGHQFVGKYPLAQYIPAAVIHGLGLGGQPALRALVWVSTISYAGVLLLLWYVPRTLGHSALSPVLMLAAIASPLSWYGTAAFGEMLAAFLALLFIAALATQSRAWLIAVTLALAGLTKEIALPFLLAAALPVLLTQWPNLDRTARRRVFAALAIGSGLAIAVSVGFNVFRYGTIFNQGYHDPSAPVRYWPRYFVSGIAAPNVGVLIEWPLAVGVIAIPAVASLRRFRTASRSWLAAQWIPLLTLLVILALLSMYFSPFGWLSWGNRYLVPWIPALLLSVACASGTEVERVLRAVAVRTRAVAAAALAVVAIVAIAHTGAISAGQNRALAWNFAPDPVCPTPLRYIKQGSPYDNRCRMHDAWGKHFVLLSGLEASSEQAGLGLALATAAAVAACAASATSLLRRRARLG